MRLESDSLQWDLSIRSDAGVGENSPNSNSYSNSRIFGEYEFQHRNSNSNRIKFPKIANIRPKVEFEL
jgi:hypothetical protein